MPTRAFVSIEDYDREATSSSFNVRDVTELTYDSTLILVDTLKDAIAAVTLGEIRSVGITKSFAESNAAVTNHVAQRESKWLVVYRDTTAYLDVLNTIPNAGLNKLFTMEIGTADTSSLLPNSEEMDISAGAGLALKNAIEAVVRSPYNYFYDDATIEVVRIVHVGRNN
jgi:hypothetical protein